MPQAGPQAVADPVGHESGFAVDQAQRTFVAGRDAQPAPVAKLLVDRDNLANHGDTPIRGRRPARSRGLTS